MLVGLKAFGNSSHFVANMEAESWLELSLWLMNLSPMNIGLLCFE